MDKFLMGFENLNHSMKLFFVYVSVLLKRKKKIFIPLIVVLGVLFFVGLNFQNIFFRKPVIYEGIIGTYTQDNLPEIVTRLLSQGLVSIRADGSAEANLAKDWQSNQEATEYTFNLKDNLYWQDGKQVHASDIDIVIPDAKTEVLNDKTIRFVLNDSFSPFPTFLDQPIFKKNSERLGIGPYKIDRIKKDQIFLKTLVLKTSKQELPDIVIRFYASEKVAKNALKLGEIQSVLGVNDIKDLTVDKSILSFSKTNLEQLVTIFYNTKDPILSDQNFRQALSYAAPAIPNELEAKTSIPPTSWAFNSEVKDYLDNPEGFKTAFSKVEKGKDSTITLTTTTNLKEVGEKVVNAWKSHGIKAVLRVESGIPQNFQALLIAHNIPFDPDQYSLWHSTQLTNISQFSDPKASPRIDKDLEDGRKTADLAVRKARYQDFQKILLDNAPATFLYFPKYNIAYRKKIDAPLKKVLELQIP